MTKLLLGALLLFMASTFVSLAARADSVGAAERGLSAAAHNKYRDAVALYSQALRRRDLSPADRAALEDKRGVAYASLGEAAKAIADFDTVIRAEPKYLFAYFNRGAALDAMGRYDAAIADFDTLIKFDPASAAAHFYRGQAEFHAGRFAPAAADFDDDVRLAPADALAVAWLHLARGRAGIGDRGRDLAKNAAAVDTARWPGPVVALYLGRLNAAQLMAAASSANRDIATDRQCQAAFYSGEGALLQHRVGDAKRALLQAERTCPVALAEYTGARAELARLP